VILKTICRSVKFDLSRSKSARSSHRIIPWKRDIFKWLCACLGSQNEIDKSALCSFNVNHHPISVHSNPTWTLVSQIVVFLNELYSCFDDVIGKHDVYKASVHYFRLLDVTFICVYHMCILTSLSLNGCYASRYIVLDRKCRSMLRHSRDVMTLWPEYIKIDRAVSTLSNCLPRPFDRAL